MQVAFALPEYFMIHLVGILLHFGTCSKMMAQDGSLRRRPSALWRMSSMSSRDVNGESRQQSAGNSPLPKQVLNRAASPGLSDAGSEEAVAAGSSQPSSISTLKSLPWSQLLWSRVLWCRRVCQQSWLIQRMQHNCEALVALAHSLAAATAASLLRCFPMPVTDVLRRIPAATWRMAIFFALWTLFVFWQQARHSARQCIL